MTFGYQSGFGSELATEALEGALRPLDKVFATDWEPPPDQRERGLALVHQYLVDTAHLTDCSVCHR